MVAKLLKQGATLVNYTGYDVATVQYTLVKAFSNT